MQPLLTPDDLNALRAINTPTISNAIEAFNLRPRNEGFMGPEIRCLFPDLGVMVGYAACACVMADRPPTPEQQALRHAWWDHVVSIPEPRIAVIQDLDQPTCIGSFLGGGQRQHPPRPRLRRLRHERRRARSG